MWGRSHQYCGELMLLYDTTGHNTVPHVGATKCSIKSICIMVGPVFVVLIIHRLFLEDTNRLDLK